MNEHMWCEDMFTPEGVPMKAPTNAGMKGPQNWKYEREQCRSDCQQKQTKTPSLACR